jgi:hypothetical protein
MAAWFARGWRARPRQFDRGRWTLVRVLLWWNEGEHTALSAWLVRSGVRRLDKEIDRLRAAIIDRVKAAREKER